MLRLRVQDRAGGHHGSRSSYTGTVPDPFREGREVIVTVEKQGAAYVGERNSLITKCPSKYKTAPRASSRTTECVARRCTEDRPRLERADGGPRLRMPAARARRLRVRHRRVDLRRAQPGASSTRQSARRSVYALAGVLTVAFAVLEVAFLRNDFAFNTVADTSSRTTPGFYRAAAVWSSQEGSLLLWAWLLSVWSSLALFLDAQAHARRRAPTRPRSCSASAGFFVALMLFYANPFATTGPAPAEGAGLDPLLRFPTMMIHPPMLYSGYTLVHDPARVRHRRAARAATSTPTGSKRSAASRSRAWLFLGVGILLGARWSYSELGWGGYWGWDAVENASLMPWLTGTAFLHSLMIQEKRGMLKVWNVSLVLATGTLAIMGTFLVRSGVLNSIHAFGGSTLGVPFVLPDRGADRGLDLPRRHSPRHAPLRAPPRLAALPRGGLHRQQHRARRALLRDLLGHVLPADLRGAERAGIVRRAALVRPLHGAARARARAAERYRAGDRVAARDARERAAQLPRADAPRRSSTLLVLLATGVGHKPLAVAMFCCAAFVFGSVGQEFYRGTRARRAMAGESAPIALLALVRRNRRRYGGYIVHLGIAVLFIGVAASSSFQHASELRSRPASRRASAPTR